MQRMNPPKSGAGTMILKAACFHLLKPRNLRSQVERGVRLFPCYPSSVAVRLRILSAYLGSMMFCLCSEATHFHCYPMEAVFKPC